MMHSALTVIMPIV